MDYKNYSDDKYFVLVDLDFFSESNLLYIFSKQWMNRIIH